MTRRNHDRNDEEKHHDDQDEHLKRAHKLWELHKGLVNGIIFTRIIIDVQTLN